MHENIFDGLNTETLLSMVRKRKEENAPLSKAGLEVQEKKKKDSFPPVVFSFFVFWSRSHL